MKSLEKEVGRRRTPKSKSDLLPFMDLGQWTDSPVPEASWFFLVFVAGSAFDFSNVLRQESYLGFVTAPDSVQRVSDKQL